MKEHKTVYLTVYWDNIHSSRYSRPIGLDPKYRDMEREALQRAVSESWREFSTAARIEATFSKPEDWNNEDNR